MSKVYLLWDLGGLTIVNPPKTLEKYLFYREKRLEPDPERPWDKRTMVHLVPMWADIEGSNPRAIQTYPGLCRHVEKFLQTNKIEYHLDDARPKFPEPNLKLMHGFRCNQMELLHRFLASKESGMLGAPTRYGKSTLIRNICRAYPNHRICVIIPGADLLTQQYEDLKKSLPDRNVVPLGGGYKTKYASDGSIDVLVSSMDSLDKIVDKDIYPIVVVDEPHASVTDARIKQISLFTNAWKFALGATLDGRFDGRDILMKGLYGEVLAERTFREAVKEGAICPIQVFMLRHKFPVEGMTLRDRQHAYRMLLWENEYIPKIFNMILERVVPPDWQTIIFIENEKQAEIFADGISEGTITMAKRFKTKKQRDEVFRQLQAGDIRICLASDIYAQGVTFSDLRVVFCGGGGGTSTKAIQKPGRLAEIRPGKNCGVLFDVLFHPVFRGNPAPTENTMEALENWRRAAWMALVRESHARMELYKKKGYDVIVVDTLNELKAHFDKIAL